MDPVDQVPEEVAPEAVAETEIELVEEDTKDTDTLDATTPVSLVDGPPEWVPDADVAECQRCSTTFNLLTRKHHCRSCGRIFCNACCSQQRLLPPKYEQSGTQRVCLGCVESNKFWPYASNTTTTPKGAVQYTSKGDGDQVVLVIHGAPGGCDQGLLVLSPLLEESTHALASFKVLCPARPGYPGSPLSLGSSFVEQADLMKEFLDSLDVERASVVAFGAGAPVAVRLASQHPSYVASLALVSPITGKHWPGQARGVPEEEAGRPFAAKMLNTFGNFALNKLPSTALSEYLAQTSDWENDMVYVRAYNIEREPQRMWLFQAFMLSMLPFSERKEGFDNDSAQVRAIDTLPFANVSAPVAVFHGRDDAEVGVAHAEAVGTVLPDAEIHIYEKTAYVPWIGKEAEQYEQDLMAFIKQHR